MRNEIEMTNNESRSFKSWVKIMIASGVYCYKRSETGVFILLYNLLMEMLQGWHFQRSCEECNYPEELFETKENRDIKF